jgi:hypothetical protein
MIPALAGCRLLFQHGREWALRVQTHSFRLGTSPGNWDGITGQFATQIHMSLPQLAFQVPHRVQQTMSVEYMPVLSGAVGIFEIFMSQWEELGKEFSKLTPWINIGLYWAKKYYKFMDDTDAYIVTMGGFFILSHHELTVDHHL